MVSSNGNNNRICMKEADQMIYHRGFVFYVNLVSQLS